jgi:hypothetical protein
MKTLKLPVLIGLGLLLASPVMADTGLARWSSFEGVWESSYGHLFFTHRTSQGALPSEGDTQHVRAAFWSYPDSKGMADNGRIVATVSGHELEGYWIQDSGEQACDSEKEGSLYWGLVRFTANPGFSEINGVWGLCDSEPTGDDINWLLWRDELRDWDPAADE